MNELEPFTRMDEWRETGDITFFQQLVSSEQSGFLQVEKVVSVTHPCEKSFR